MGHASEKEIAEVGVGQCDDHQDRQYRGDGRGTLTALAGEQRRDHDDEGSDHRWHYSKKRIVHSGKQDREQVERRVDAPERVDRKRPSAKRDVTGRHRLTLEHDRRAVRVGH